MAEPGLSVWRPRWPAFSLLGGLLSAPARQLRKHPPSQGLALLVMTGIHVFFATAGTFRFEHGMRYYDELGAAFSRGQLYLAEQPKPELLALANPYDSTQNAGLTLHDAALYMGHYYLYFGPTPALIHAIWHVFTGLPLDDGLVEVGAAVTATVAFWGILARVQASCAPTTRGWLVIASTFAFSVGGLMLYLVGRPAVYHEAILVAMACMFAGCYSLVLALEAERWKRSLILLAGVLLGCAVASRITYLAYAFGVGVALVLRALLAPRGARLRQVQDVGIFAAPLLATGALLLLYNWARFDSPFEFGTSYQLAGNNVSGSITCGPKYLPTDAAVYLLAVPKLLPYYPFFMYDAGAGWGLAFPTPEQVPLATGMQIELPLVSPFLLQPIALLSLLLVPIALLQRRSLGPLVSTLALALLLGTITTIPLLGCVYGITFRYFADLTPALALLGSLALVLSHHRLSQHGPGERRFSVRRFGRPLLVSFAVLSWLVSVTLGILLGLGVWQYTFPEQIVPTREESNELFAGLNAIARPQAIDNWDEPTEGTTWRTPEGRYFQESTIYLRATEPGASLILALDWHDLAPTQLIIQVNGVDTDQQTLLPGRHLVVSRAIPGLPLDALVGVRLSLPGVAGAQPGAVLPLSVQRVYFTRGAAEAAAYRTLATGIEQTPSASDELLATSGEMLARQTLSDNQAALLETQAALQHTEDVLGTERQVHADTQSQLDQRTAALAAAQTEITRLQDKLAQLTGPEGHGP